MLSLRDGTGQSGMNSAKDGMGVGFGKRACQSRAHNLSGFTDFHYGLLSSILLGFRSQWVAEESCGICPWFASNVHRGVRHAKFSLMAEVTAT